MALKIRKNFTQSNFLHQETFRQPKSNSKDTALANKGLKAWWSKMGKRFRSLSNSDFPDDEGDFC
jgi:hypothetical protein